MGLMIFILVIVGLVVWLVTIFNGLTRGKNQAKNAFSQIDVQLKRRLDLIPSLVNATKGYLSHEQQTLEAVTQARNHAAQIQQNITANANSLDNPALIHKLVQSQNEMSKALAGMYAVIESYPELKADQLVKQLVEELSNTENRISFARQHYNDSVMSYNNRREVFPNNLISSSFNFRPMSLLQFADKAQIDVAPVVNLSF